MKKEKDKLPRNLSAWMDLTVHLAVMLALILLLSYYNRYLAVIAMVLWGCLAMFAFERCTDRAKRFERYCKSVVGSIKQMMTYAVENLPQAIVIINEEGRIEWTNERVGEVMGKIPDQDADAKELWPNILIKEIWGKEGDYVAGANIAGFIKVADAMMAQGLV